MEWSMSISPHWAAADCDPDVWLMIPHEIPEAWPDAETWAVEGAEARWRDSGLRYGRRAVGDLAGTLISYHLDVESRAWAHQMFLHLRDPRQPLAVYLGSWRSEGERAAALRFYSGADDPGASGPPIVERFATERLGAGLRVLARFPRHGLSRRRRTVLSYAWRVEAYETDLCLFTHSLAPDRLHSALADIDGFARGIRPEPDPGGEHRTGAGDTGPAGDGFSVDQPSYRLALNQVYALAAAPGDR